MPGGLRCGHRGGRFLGADPSARGHRCAGAARLRPDGGSGLSATTPSRPAPVALRARGWGWRHAGRLAWALRGVDLDVGPGERVLLLGPSGAGKSTLLAACAGLLGEPHRVRPDGVAEHENGGESEGELLLDGVPAARARVGDTARAGLLLQDPDAQTVLARCGDDVAFGLENHAVPRERIWLEVDAALRSVGFAYGRMHPTSRLSGGERQRLALAGVLALRPGLLLLDEPTSMLDAEGAALLRAAVRRIVSETGATVVVVEHRVADWLADVDRVVVLEPGGGVVADGAPADVLERHGARLAQQGVWVPRHPPVVRPRVRPAAADPVLVAEGLSAGRPGSPRPVVQDLDVVLRAGAATCVTGPNGAGKSTLAQVLGGLVPPAGGVLRAEDRLARGLSPEPCRWRPRELVTRIGSVFQEPQHQFVASSVADELVVGPRHAGLGRAPARGRAAELLERLGLDHLARANPFTLSGGEQRRLSVATALATRPDLLVLDEPTFGQDPRTWAELVRLLVELLEDGVCVAAVTHDRALVNVLADVEVVLGPSISGDPVGQASSARAVS